MKQDQHNRDWLLFQTLHTCSGERTLGLVGSIPWVLLTRRRLANFKVLAANSVPALRADVIDGDNLDLQSKSSPDFDIEGRCWTSHL